MMLPKYTDFSHFGRDLFITTVGYKFCNDEQRLLGFSDLCDDSLPIVDDMCFYDEAFRHTYRHEFLSVFRQAEYDDFKTEEQFLRYAIPRCLNLVVPEMYFYSLSLVSAFLREFVEFLYKTRRCYRFHMVAHKCYAAVFKRAFESSFESHGGFEGLEEYLEELKRKSPTDEDSIPEPLDFQEGVDCPPQARSMIENCCPVHDDFVLNEFERTLLAADIPDEILDEDSDSEPEDPLRFEWPIRPEQVLSKIESTPIPVDPLYALAFSDDSSFDAEEEEEYSDLSRYADVLEWEAEERWGGYDAELHGKINNRMCPCCGVRCWKFSSALLYKQLAVSLKKTPRWKKNLFIFIGRCRKRITYLIRFSRVVRADVQWLLEFIS